MTQPSLVPNYQNLHISFDEGDLQSVLTAFEGPGFSGKAPIISRYEAAIRAYFGVDYALATCNGTVAIELALRGLGLGPGARVGLPPTAPIMTILPILMVGCEPVFYDVSRDDFGPDLDDLQVLVTQVGLDALITVPMWGYPWDVNPVARLCKEAGIALIEDCAHAFGTAMDGRMFGTFGDVSAFSTHERKLVSTGEGGFCLTPHPEVLARMRQWQHHGASADTHGVERLGRAFGTNYKLAPLCAALGISQFAKLDAKVAARRAVVAGLRARIADLSMLTEMRRHPGSEVNGYATVWWHHGPRTRMLTARLAERGIQSDTVRYDYKPLYREPAFERFARDCPNAERMIASILTLPCHEGLSAQDLDTIARITTDVLSQEAAPEQAHVSAA